jgi:CRP/FNR family transcriptional regulator, cyclic AMP receptor protein
VPDMAIGPKFKTRCANVPDALSRLLFVAARPQDLKAGQVLFASGDAGDGCYLLDRGLLKVTVTSSHGEQRIIAMLGPGSLVGELSMIDGRPRSASVVALSDCSLRFTSREAFAKYMATHPEAYEALVAILAFRLRQAHEVVAATTFLTVKQRVARALVELAEYVGTPSSAGRIVLREKISLAEIAAMAGVARESVSRVMSEWRRRKLISGPTRHYCLNDIGALTREVHSKRRSPRGRPATVTSDSSILSRGWHMLKNGQSP